MSEHHRKEKHIVEPGHSGGFDREEMWFNAVSIASIVTVIVFFGLMMRPQKHEATVLISFNPSQIVDHWDLLKDETRVVDFEGQIRSRAVLAPALIKAGYKQKRSGRASQLNGDVTQLEQDTISDERIAKIIREFQPHLDVERIRQSSLLEVSVRLTSPKMATDTANAIVGSFFDLKRKQFRDQAYEHINAIEREMEGIQRELTVTINERNAFLKENGWNDYDLELAAATNRVLLLKQKLMKFKFGNSNYTIKELSQNLPVTVLGNSAMLDQAQDSNLNLLVQKMNELEARYVQVKSRFKKGSPPVFEITREKRDLEQSIAEYVEERKSVLSSQLAAAQKESQKLLNVGSKMQIYQVAIDQSENSYQELMNQRSTIRMRSNSLDANTNGFGALRLIDSAIIPEQDSALKKLLILIASVVATFVVSFSLMIIMFEVWNQATEHIARERNKVIDPTGYFNKLI